MIRAKAFTRVVAVLMIGLMLQSCASAASILAVASAEVKNASNLPSLTAAQKAWLQAAAAGLSCSSGVLAKNEATAQELLDIGVCFANLPIIPASDQAYITLAIGAVQAFIILYDPAYAINASVKVAGTESGKALEFNTKLRSAKAADRSRMLAVLATLQTQNATVRDRLAAR